MTSIKCILAAFVAALSFSAFAAGDETANGTQSGVSYDTREECEKAVRNKTVIPYTPEKTVADKRNHVMTRLGNLFNGKYSEGVCHNGADTVYNNRYVYFPPDFPVAVKRGSPPLMWQCMNDLNLDKAVPIKVSLVNPVGACEGASCAINQNEATKFTYTQTIIVAPRVRFVCQDTGQTVNAPSDCVTEVKMDAPTFRLVEQKDSCPNIISPSGQRPVRGRDGCCSLAWKEYKN